MTVETVVFKKGSNIEGCERCVKLNIRIGLAGSHLLIGAFSLIGALLTLYKVPTSFGTIQVLLGEIYYTDTVFDRFTQLFLLGIISLYTLVTSFYGFRFWCFCSASSAFGTLLAYVELTETLPMMVVFILVLVSLFQLCVVTYFIFQKLKSRAETG